MAKANVTAIGTLEQAGKYLCNDRNLYKEVSTLTATQAAKHSNPDVQAFAVLSVLMARVVNVMDDGWCGEIARTLGFPEMCWNGCGPAITRMGGNPLCAECADHYEDIATRRG